MPPTLVFWQEDLTKEHMFDLCVCASRWNEQRRLNAHRHQCIHISMCVQLGITKDCQSIFINGSAFWQTKIAWATLVGYQWIGYWKSSTSTNISITIKWFLVVVDGFEAGASVSSLKSYGKISKYSTYKYLFRLFGCNICITCHVLTFYDHVHFNLQVFRSIQLKLWLCFSGIRSYISIFFGWYFGTHLRFYVWLMYISYDLPEMCVCEVVCIPVWRPPALKRFIWVYVEHTIFPKIKAICVNLLSQTVEQIIFSAMRAMFLTIFCVDFKCNRENSIGSYAFVETIKASNQNISNATKKNIGTHCQNG